MGTRDLPDMYALSPRALGIHIRQITRAHVTTIKCNPTVHMYVLILMSNAFGTNYIFR